MQNGNICVSVGAETADELERKVVEAAEIGDMIELRLDYLKPEELEKVWKLPASEKFEITTFRPDNQGGKRALSLTRRKEFWNSGKTTLYGDFEHDLLDEEDVLRTKYVIASYHDFEKTPDNLTQIYDELSSKNPDIVKIAVWANDFTDSVKVWKLLKKAKSDGKELIPIAMGEAGKWTRILGLAHGAPITYGALESASETAPGQISAMELKNVYRVKELNEKTEVYGVLGDRVSHSLSPYMHNALFGQQDKNAVYIPFAINTLEEFINAALQANSREIILNFKGFSVTIPHKQAIIKHLDFIDETAQKIGAVNTVKIVDRKLHGFNTDADGFLVPLKKAFSVLSGAKVAIAGAGGAAKACIYALISEGANVTVFARDTVKAHALSEDFGIEVAKLSNLSSHLGAFEILVNTTPLGMRGDLVSESIARAAELKNLKLVYDLVYNPAKTVLIQETEKAGVAAIGGLEMLVAQAAAQQKIWTGQDAPTDLMRKAVTERLN